MEGVFAVITCDLHESRLIPEREKVQMALKRAIEEINVRHANTIVSPFGITLGDEWQGLIRDPGMSYEIVDGFRECLGGIRFYAGIGIGGLTTPIGPVQEMDGPAFYLARAAVESAKEKGPGVVFSFGDSRKDACVNAFVRLVERVRAGRTGRQAEVIAEYERVASMERVGARFGITKQSVSKVLRAAMWEEEQAAHQQIGILVLWLAGGKMEGKMPVVSDKMSTSEG